MERFPQIILEIETLELGIAAGLQDRVIQVYGGLCHMDFTGIADGATAGIYTKLDSRLLPPLYLAYNTRVGGDSGKVHSTVKQRWTDKDPELMAGMAEIAALADEGRVALLQGQPQKLGPLFLRNFATRRRLYGDGVVGAKNIAAAGVAASVGLCAKFSGSGGALLCIRSEDSPQEW